MILDAQKGFGHEPPRYDLCIVGAGAAGITLALELEATGRRVCLLEAGGAVYEAETQRLLEGEVVGQAYPPLRDTRVGALGGSTTVWAGWCRPLEALDFEPRAWYDAGGWPFGLDELRPYYARAHEICGLAAFDYDPERWAGVLGPERILPRDPTFTNEIFHVQVQNFGQRYRERLERSKYIDLVLHAPVTRARLEDAACTAVEIRTLDGDDLAIRADRFVLAAGGVENPRLLLLSAVEPAGAPGNAGGLVGRYFTDHAFVDPGTLVLRQPDSMDFYQPRPGGPEPGGELGPGLPVTPPRGRGARASHERLLVLPPPIRSPLGLRNGGGEGLADAVEQGQAASGAGSGLAVCQAGHESPSPAGRGDGAQACGETCTGTTLAHACGLRYRLPVRQPRDAERRARPRWQAQSTHRVADR